jgi:stage II sporulation protein AA (anti-sigma F factor antagonist)
MRKDVLDVVVSYLGEQAQVIVRGQIDRDSASTLRAVLDELEPDSYAVIDMAGVHYINSSGLTMLVAQAEWMRQRDGGLHIKNPSPAVQEAVDQSDTSWLLYEQDLRPYPAMATGYTVQFSPPVADQSALGIGV